MCNLYCTTAWSLKVMLNKVEMSQSRSGVSFLDTLTKIDMCKTHVAYILTIMLHICKSRISVT